MPIHCPRPGRALARMLEGLAHLVPLAACALLLVAAASLARAQEGEAQAGPDACRPGVSALAKLQADGALPGLEAKAAETANGEGRLFRISRPGDGRPSYLFGTMHLSDPRVLALPAPAEAAFKASDGLVIETTDVLDDAAMAAALLSRPELTTIPDGRGLDDLLTEEEIAGLKPVLEAHAMPIQAVRTLQPWFLTMGLMIPACEAARGAGGAKVLDVDLAARARAEGKSVAGLETAAEQLEALSSMPLDLQADNLVASAAILDRLPDIFETMTELYLGGRIALIQPATEAMVPSGTDEAVSIAVTQAFEERVVDRRNGVMAERLQPILTEGGRFVAVGALHLPGRTGLVAALRAAGWTVTRAD